MTFLLVAAGVLAAVVWLVLVLRQSGKDMERIKQLEAQNEQDDKMLAHLVKKRNFERRLRADAALAERLRQLDDRRKK